MKSVRNLTLCLAFLLAATLSGWAQSSPARAIDNVTIHTASGTTIKNGTIIWRDGVIEAVGKKVSIPFDAYVIDGGDSLHVYPGFIDGMALWGSPDLPKQYKRPDDPGNPGYERAGIQPQRKTHELLKSDNKELSEAQKHGFTTAVLGLKGQMLPGQADIYFINGKQTGDYLYKKQIAMVGTFESAPGGFRSGAYPSTLMGVMASYRQLWYDARALKAQEKYYASVKSDYPAPKKNPVLEAIFPLIDQEQPMYFVVDSKENIERMFWLKDELGFNPVIVSGKEAYGQAANLKQRNIPVLASVELPEKPAFMKEDEKKDKNDSVPLSDLEEMKHFQKRQKEAWQEEVMNIKKLMDAGIKVGYASNGMKLSDFLKYINILKEDGGLNDNQILKMLTQNTADILGIGTATGDIKEGRIASFTVFTKPFTEEKAKTLYSVSDGKVTEF